MSTPAERLLMLVTQIVLANLPLGVSAEYFQGFMARNQTRLLEMFSQHLAPLGLMEAGIVITQDSEPKHRVTPAHEASFTALSSSLENSTYATHSKAPGLVASPSIPSVSSQADTASEAPSSGSNEPNKSAWGGISGDFLFAKDVVKGMRVVNNEGEHGVVTNISVNTFLISKGRIWSGETPIQQEEKTYEFLLKLDNSRQERNHGLLWQELASPTHVLPDLKVYKDMLERPKDAWKTVQKLYHSISSFKEKASRARKPADKSDYMRSSLGATSAFNLGFRVFHAFREKFAAASMPYIDPLLYRIYELEVGVIGPFPQELAWLKQTPSDWGSTYRDGDWVWRPEFARFQVEGENAGGILPPPTLVPDVVEYVKGDYAKLASEPNRWVALYYLRPRHKGKQDERLVESWRVIPDRALSAIWQGGPR